jgi:hypothetical protein
LPLLCTFANRNIVYFLLSIYENVLFSIYDSIYLRHYSCVFVKVCIKFQLNLLKARNKLIFNELMMRSSLY